MTDETVDLTWRDVQAQIIHSFDLSESFSQMFNRKHGKDTLPSILWIFNIADYNTALSSLQRRGMIFKIQGYFAMFSIDFYAYK